MAHGGYDRIDNEMQYRGAVIMFRLHEQLARDCVPIGRFPLCQLLLMGDANYPWFILVPRRQGVREIYELSVTDQHELQCESSLLARWLAQAFAADKLNIAVLGNKVPQLHVHHIARYRGDPAWPHPVWGRVPIKPYAAEEIEALCTSVLTAGLDGLREDF